jgi:hypothetical protein
MSILNEGYFPYIDATLNHSVSIEFRDCTEIWRLKSWNDADYYYCEIKLVDNIDSVPISDFIDKKTLSRIRSDDKTFLVLSNSHESFHTIVDPIYRYFVIKEKIPATKILLMSESADLYKEVAVVADRYKKPRMKVEWMLMFEKNIKLFRSELPIRYFKNTNYSNKKFINLNRRWRLHRVAFVALLASKDLLKFGNVSLGLSDDGRRWDKMIPWILRQYSEDAEICELIEKNKNNLLNMGDMYLDTENLVENQVDLNVSLNEFYEETFFTIVSETNYNTSDLKEVGRFLSEKTFKPISHYHPFIMLSVPFFLDALKELGYKTFHPWIDERYDREEDDSKRLMMCVNEVERLCNLTDREVTDFIAGTEEIVQHNFKHLMERNTYIYKKL